MPDNTYAAFRPVKIFRKPTKYNPYNGLGADLNLFLF